MSNVRRSTLSPERPGPALRDVSFQQLDPQGAAEVEELHRRFGPVLGEMAKARKDPELWNGILKTPTYGELLVHVRRLIIEQDSRRRLHTDASVATMVFQEVVGASDYTATDWLDLRHLDTATIADGSWMPKSARMRRIKDDPIVADKNTQDPITYGLSKLSKKYCDPGKPLGIKEYGAQALYPLYWAGHAALPIIDGAGDIVAAPFEEFAGVLDRAGEKLCNEVQLTYRAMGKALKGSGISKRSLKKLPEEEQRMVLFAASIVGGMTGEMADVWLEQLKDPNKRRDPGVWAKIVDSTRIGVDAAQTFFEHAADFIQEATDHEALRSANIGVILGGALEKGTVSTGAGVSFFLPTLDEVMRTGKVKIRSDFSWCPVNSPFFGTGAGSFGGKMSVKPFPGLSIQEGDYAQQVKIGIPFIKGIGINRWKTFGPGLEVGRFPTLLNLQAFGVPLAVRGGGNLLVFHQALANGWVSKTAHALGDTVDTLTAPLSAGWLSLKGTTKHALDKAGLKKPKEVLPSSTHELYETRMGRNVRAFEKGSAALGRLVGYQRAIGRSRSQGAPLAEPGSAAAHQISRGFSTAQAEEIIENYVTTAGERLEGLLEKVTEILCQPEGTPVEELKIRKGAELRRLSNEIRKATAAFEFVDMVLAPVFRTTQAGSIGPFASFFESGASGSGPMGEGPKPDGKSTRAA